MSIASLSVGKINDDFDIVIAPRECLVPALEWYVACNKARKPITISPSQGFRRCLIVASIGVDRTEYHVIFEHNSAVESAEIKGKLVAARRHTGKTNDAIRRSPCNNIEDHGRCAGTFDDNVRAEVRKAARMVSCTKRANEFRLHAVAHPIKYMHIEALLRTDQRSQQADRARASHQRNAWLPAPTALADAQRCSQALVTMLVGSSSTPRAPRTGSIFTRKSGSTRNCCEP